MRIGNVLALGSLFGAACVAFAQQAPIGDVYQSGSGSGAQSPAQAVQNLYKVTLTITEDPSSGYDAKTDHWPEADAAQQQWDQSMALNGNALTQQQRAAYIPCAAHLGNALDSAERGYRIQRSQQGNSAAQATVQKLDATARSELAQCNLGALDGSNDSPAGSSPGSASGAPVQGGVNSGADGSGSPGGSSPVGGPSGPAGPARGGQPPSNSGGSGSANPALLAALNFTNRLAADAETLLQDAGRISKAMTDAMDVSKHNNVGIGIGFGAGIGAAGQMMGVVAEQYRALGAVSGVAAQDVSLLKIANTAASESTTYAGQVEQTVSRLGPAGSAAGSGAQQLSSHLEDMVLYGAEEQPALVQGNLPTCAVLSCDRLAQLLGRNIPIMTIFEKIRPNIALSVTPSGETIVTGGLTPAEIQAGLNSLRIKAQVESGIGNLTSDVAAGNPAIAMVYPQGPQNAALHAVVVQAAEARGTVQGLKIYDPMGFVYWQPAQTFAKYFAGEFIKAL